MRVQSTRRFDREYERLSGDLKDRTDRQIRLLSTNPNHPSLRLKKMQGTDAVWEVRITRTYRVTLEVAGDLLILRRVGAHDVLKHP
jgi:mRNA-degrading endonuclease RelE of RelBE toxin-antitoxin system